MKTKLAVCALLGAVCLLALSAPIYAHPWHFSSGKSEALAFRECICHISSRPRGIDFAGRSLGARAASPRWKTEVRESL